MTAGPRCPGRCRLAIVINSLEGGGAERVLSVLLGEFEGALREETGFDIDLVLLDDLPRKYPTPEGVRIHVLDARQSLGRSVAATWRAIGRLRPDAVLGLLTRSNFAVVLACRPRRIPCLISERVNTSSHFSAPGVRNALSRALVRLIYPRADRVLAVSEGVAQDLAERHGVPAARLAVIHNPYHLEAIRGAAEAPPALAGPGGRPYLVAVGRLTPNKNFGLLIDAYAASGVTEGLAILGEGETRAALEAQARRLGVAERVVFAGFLDNPYPVVARATAFVSASNAEGFPNAAAEAMALGRPTAMTDCPSGPAELIGGRAPPGAGVVFGRHGLLVPMGDRDALAEAMRIVVDPVKAADLGASARARMEDFRAVNIARAYLREISAAIASPRDR